MEASEGPIKIGENIIGEYNGIKKESDKAIENIRKILRPIKYSLIDLFISLTRVFFCWLPGGDMGKGQALMICHFLGGIILYIIYFILAPNQSLRLFIFFFFVIIVLQQLIFRSCVITKAEQKLTGLTDTILDPLIHLVGFEPTRELRLATSISVIGTATTTLLINTVLDQFRMFS